MRRSLNEANQKNFKTGTIRILTATFFLEIFTTTGNNFSRSYVTKKIKYDSFLLNTACNEVTEMKADHIVVKLLAAPVSHQQLG